MGVSMDKRVVCKELIKNKNRGFIGCFPLGFNELINRC